MALQYSTTVRNAQLDTIESTIGTAPILKIFAGSVPANCAAADPATTLATLTLPSDWMAAASSGSKAKSGTWSANAGATGTAGCWRIYDSSGVTCHMQGTCTASGGGGDMILDSTSLTSGQPFVVQTFAISAANS